MAGERAYQFGPFRLEVALRRLMRDGEPVALTPKAFDLLFALIERRDRVVDKTELMQLVWPDSFVEESNLTQTIFVLRKTLGDDAGGQPYIETVPRHGYRFVASVAVVEPAPAGGQGPPRRVPPWQTAAAGLGLIIAIAVAWRLTDARSGVDAPFAGQTRIVVLPFENLTNNRGDDWLASAFADSLTTGLQASPDLISVSRDRVIELYKANNLREGPALDAASLRGMSQQLGVRYYVHGSYQRIGSQVKVSARIVDIVGGTNEVQESLTDAYDRLLALQDELAERVAAKFEAGRRAASRPETSSLEAYRETVEGLNHYGAGALVDARSRFERAVQLDPSYARGWALLSKTLSRLTAPGTYLSGPVEPLRAAALDSARKATQLDHSLYDGHVALALAYRSAEQTGAWRDEAERALKINPRLAEAYGLIADWEAATPAFGCARGHSAARADEHYRMTLRLDPRQASMWGNWVFHLVWDGRAAEAIREADKGLAAVPGTPFIRRARNMALLFGGQAEEAEREIRATAAASPSIAVYDRWLLATVDLLRNHTAEASAGFEAVTTAMPETSYDFRIVWSHLLAGRADAAMTHLDRAVTRSRACADYAAWSPALAPYRHLPQFRARLAAWKIPPS